MRTIVIVLTFISTILPQLQVICSSHADYSAEDAWLIETVQKKNYKQAYEFFKHLHLRPKEQMEHYFRLLNEKADENFSFLKKLLLFGGALVQKNYTLAHHIVTYRHSQEEYEYYKDLIDEEVKAIMSQDSLISFAAIPAFFASLGAGVAYLIYPLTQEHGLKECLSKRLQTATIGLASLHALAHTRKYQALQVAMAEEASRAAELISRHQDVIKKARVILLASLSCAILLPVFAFKSYYDNHIQVTQELEELEKLQAAINNQIATLAIS